MEEGSRIASSPRRARVLRLQDWGGAGGRRVERFNISRREAAYASDSGPRMSVQKGAIVHPFFKIVSALALGLSISGCVTAEPPYPNVVPIDTTGNFGAT
jgi:hypothetical protein